LNGGADEEGFRARKVSTSSVELIEELMDQSANVLMNYLV
jgi:hypothetical protein